MTRSLIALLTAAALAPALRAADPPKPLEAQVFEQFLARHKDATYEQLVAKAYKARAFAAGPDAPEGAKHFARIKGNFALTEAELGLFRKNGFVSVDLGHRHTFASLYFQAYAQDLPVLVTADSILHALHVSYDDILKELEMGPLSRTVAHVLKNAQDELGRRGAKDDNARDVDLYLTVARNLLAGASAPADPKERAGEPAWDGKLLVPSALGQDAEALALLNAVQSLKFNTPGRNEPPTRIYGGERYPDFSQFRPRGHYTATTELRRYFRCMMWMGRVDCGWNVLPTDGTPGVRSDSDRELRDAVLFCELLAATNGVKPLKSADDLITFMVGRSDNLNVFVLLDLMGKVGVKDIAAARDDKALERLKDELKTGKHAAQMIRSQLVVSNPWDTYKVPPPSTFQVFGQRYVIDSFVLSQVVFDSILFENQKQRRMMPTGLDVMAALGNDEAIPLLEGELRQWNYSANLLASRDYVAAHGPAYWKSNLYTVWLDCLRTLSADMTAHKHFPKAMRTKAWQMKQLQTQLGSWAELRHDTVLYAKQSYSATPACEYPTGYVEPYPEFYAKVKFFADEAARLFAAADLPDPNPATAGESAKQRDGFVAFFKNMSERMGALEVMARKELAGEPFTAAEKVFIKQLVDKRGGGSGAARYDGWYCRLFYQYVTASQWNPVVTDVHTDPESKTCLQVGTGDAMVGVVVVECDGEKTAYVGPLFSFYEFRQPIEKRLTDQEWQRKIPQAGQFVHQPSGEFVRQPPGTTPPRPDWVKEFQAPRREK